MSQLVKTKRQASFKDFKRLEPLRGSSVVRIIQLVRV
jgi:hypothetical protein